MAKRARCEERLFLMGRVPRQLLPLVYHHSDVFVLAARSEAFGVALLEAMAAGLPVVSYDVGGISEIVTNREMGILVKSGDVKGLAQAILDVLLDDERRGRFVKAGVRRAQDFSVQSMIDKLRAMYQQMSM